MQFNEPETWNPVVGYEGIYEVSDLGRVRSLERMSSQGRLVKSRILKQTPTSNGLYLKVDLVRGGKSTRRTVRVHRLVAEAFLGAPPSPERTDCCHEDGDGHNNAVSNLRWDTHANNVRDKDLHGTNFHKNKTHCPKGHELTPENLVRHHWEKRGHRMCKTCANDRAREAARAKI